MPGERTLPDKIAREIRRDVAAGVLAAGDSLPTETDLAGRFGVSRNVMREALARLRSDGVIETRQGRGPVILPETRRTAFRIEPSDIEDAESLAALFQVRQILEIDAARLAAANRSDEDARQLGEVLDRMKGCSELNDDMFSADVEFHRTISRASGNKALASIIGYIASRLIEESRTLARALSDDSLLETTILEHQKIYEAIILGDADAAETAMRAHLRRAAESSLPPRQS